jgi:hypothetical protein
MTTLESPLAETDIEHRQAFERFVLEQAEPWHREYLGRLYAHWEEANGAYFGGQLVVPYILLAEPASPTTYGVTRSVSSFGGRCEIRLRPSLLKGTHPHTKDGTGNPEGLFRLIADVLLHEIIHQWQQEILDENEEDYHGHGPKFAAEANEIGAILGLSRVRTSKKRGPEAGLPSCAQWPHCVRPPDYYLGAYVPPNRDKEKVNLADLAADQMLELAATLSQLGPDWGERPKGEVDTRLDAQHKLAEAFEDIGLWVTSFGFDDDEEGLAERYPVEMLREAVELAGGAQ